MRIGNESLLNHPIAAFVGPRDGLESQDKQRFTDAIDHWLNTGGVVLTGGALGADALAIEAAMNWAYDNHKDHVPVIVALPRTNTPIALNDKHVLNAVPKTNAKLFDGVADSGGLIIQKNQGATVPDRDAYLDRDALMVKLAEHVFVAAYLNPKSGTGATIRHAQRNNVPVTICGRNLVSA